VVVLRYADPARITAYILSDETGDDLRAIASGPTVAPNADRATAGTVCKDAGIWARLPGSVRNYLSLEEEIPISVSDVQNHLIDSNRHSLRAALQASPPKYNAHIASDPLIGDVEEVAQKVAATCLQANPSRPVLCCLVGNPRFGLKATAVAGIIRNSPSGPP